METSSITVLLIEDNPDDAEIVTRMLARYGRAAFDVHHVGGTTEALVRLRDDEFDLVLLDYGLPGEDGLSFLGRLKTQPGIPPIIMLTGQGDQRIAQKAVVEGAFDYFPKDALSSDALGFAIHQAFDKHRMELRLFDQQVEGIEQVMFTMAAAAEAKDPTTEHHLRRMSQYAVHLGLELGLNERDLLLLRYGGILHDIGKLGVSEAILRAPRPLSQSEWMELRQHPLIGERICSPLRLSHALGPIIRHHHERWDGGGYVDGLAGEDIPYLARVVSIVDSFDAMTSDRPYRAALPFEEAVRRLRAGAGAQWDPDIAGAFLKLLQREGRAFVLHPDSELAA